MVEISTRNAAGALVFSTYSAKLRRTDPGGVNPYLQLIIKTKMLKIKDFSCHALRRSDVVFTMLINVKIPTICILT